MKEYDLCHDCAMIRSENCAFLEQKNRLLSEIPTLRSAGIDRQPKKKTRKERTKEEQVEWNRRSADLVGCPQATPTGRRFNLGPVVVQQVFRI